MLPIGSRIIVTHGLHRDKTGTIESHHTFGYFVDFDDNTRRYIPRMDVKEIPSDPMKRD